MPAETELLSPCLETAKGERILLAGNCSLGRLSENTIKIDSARASRRHATIHGQDAGEYWLIDLGSVNGTLLNGRRISLPTRLQDGDSISIADHLFTFRGGEPGGVVDDNLCAATVVTAPRIENKPCWLLVADVERYTELSQRIAPETLAMVMGRWIHACKAAIEDQGGVMNKYLGDGFLAFWRGDEETASSVAAAATALRKLQAMAEPAFRVVVHHGMVTIGGAATLGEECLMGPEVNFAFRMEGAAGPLGVHFCISASAAERLGRRTRTAPLPGAHALKGFSGEHEFFTLA